jgi:hypothetical protein
VDVKILYLGDKLSNIRSVYRGWRKDGDTVWRDFNQADPAKQAWYYRSIAEYTRELADTLPWQEYNKLVQIIFAEVPTHE